jgi:integrase
VPRHPPRKRKLTEILVRRQRPAARAYLVWDTRQYGLALRIRPTGTRTYSCIYSFHGRPRWLHLGNANAIGLAAARQLAAEAMLQVAKGIDPAAERRAMRTKGTFAELAQRYVDEYASKRNRSWRQAEALIQRYCLPKWGKLNPTTITRADVRTMLAPITAPVLANQVLAAASAIFSWAVKQDILTTNPCRGIERNATTDRERVLDDGEIEKFWRAFDDCGLIAGAALKLILLTGQRPGEVTCMHHAHINEGWWTLPGAPDPKLGWPGTKNAATHRVWLAGPVLEILAAFAGDEGRVFAGLRRNTLAVAMRDICSALGVPRATPHDLRRTFSSRVTALGFGRDAMNRVTNHKEGGIASVYDRHQYTEENKRIMAAVAAHIMAKATGTAGDKVVPFNR